MEPLIEHVDHVFVPVDEPEYLFSLFTEGLGLPVAWPITDYGAFRSGGVSLGNANIEILAAARDSDNHFFEARLPATVRGVAFTPAESATANTWSAQLTQRRLHHSLPYRFALDPERPLWTTCGIEGLVADTCIPFLCDYHDASVVRPDAAKELAERGGGPLGLIGLEEITVGVKDDETALRRWQRLMDPAQPVAPGTWRPGGKDRAAIRVQASPIEGVAGLTVRVRDVEATRAALKAMNLLGPSRANGCGLRHPDTLGLDVWFTA